MSQDKGLRTVIENVLIVACLLGGLGLLLLGWYVGDDTAQAQTHQWQLVFLGLGLILTGQWIVGGSPTAKKQQIAATSLALALVGVAIQYYYHLSWAQSTPFIVSYVFLFLAAELCFFLGRDWSVARRMVQYLRFAVVGWNVAWGLYYLTTSFITLPDVVNLYIAFSWLWTAATAIIGWSELCKVRDITPDRDSPTPPPHDSIDISTLSGHSA